MKSIKVTSPRALTSNRPHQLNSRSSTPITRVYIQVYDAAVRLLCTGENIRNDANANAYLR